VEPVAAVGTDLLSGFQFDNRSFFFAEETTHEVVVIDFAQETDALTVFSLSTGQTGFQCQVAYLILHQPTQRKHQFGYLQVVDLRQEVGLIFHRIFGSAQPYLSVLFHNAGVMSRSGLIKVLSRPFFKTAKLDEFVAHHIRIGSKPFPYFVDGVRRHPVPVFFM